MATEAEHAFGGAVEFHDTAIRCGEFLGPDACVNLGARTVCFALAVELYFKSLVIRRLGKARRKKLSVHELALLYRDWLDDHERARMVHHYRHYRNATKRRMMRELGEISKAFVQWRYSHENDGLLFSDQGALSAFAKAAYLTVKESSPDWDVKPFVHDRLVAGENMVFFNGKMGPDQAAFHEAVRWSLYYATVARGDPKANVTKGEQQRFRRATWPPHFYGQTAALKLKFRGSSYAEDGGSDELVE